MASKDSYDPVRVARSRFGGELRRLRKDANLTQQALAALIKTGDSTVSDLERGIGTRAPDEQIVNCYLDECLKLVNIDAALVGERRRGLLDQYASLARLIFY